LSDRLVAIAEASLAQSERVLSQTQVARNVGDQSGYDLLRAQVARDNQVPTVLQQRTNRDLAYVRLKQLIGLDPDAPMTLTSVPEMTPEAPTATLRAASLSDAEEIPSTVVGAASAAGVALTVEPSDTSADARAAVRQQEEAVRQEEATLRYTRAQRLPSVSLTASYGKLAYPTDLFPTANQFYTSASVGISVSVPLYTGGQQRANELAAEAQLDRSRAQLSQTRKSAALDARQALLTLAQAEATFAAGAQTATQATRAYEIAEVRYREGLAAQTEVSEARIAQNQALSNRAQAARDLLVARVRLALLSDLPLNTTTTTTTTSSSISSTGTGTGGGTGTGSQGSGSGTTRTASTSATQTSSSGARTTP
jgi:outer membrane protein